VEAIQIGIGIVLIVLGTFAFLRTRRLLQFLVALEEPPLSQAHRDRIASTAFIYHLIAGLTSLAGVGVILLAVAN